MANPFDFVRRVKTGIAEGLNQSAQILLLDISKNVPVRTGDLLRSYAITKVATLDSLTIKISSPKDYAAKFYPETDNRGRRPRLTGTRPTLFGSGSQDRREHLVAGEVQEAIARQF